MIEMTMHIVRRKRIATVSIALPAVPRIGDVVHLTEQMAIETMVPLGVGPPQEYPCLVRAVRFEPDKAGVYGVVLVAEHNRCTDFNPTEFENLGEV